MEILKGFERIFFVAKLDLFTEYFNTVIGLKGLG